MCWLDIILIATLDRITPCDYRCCQYCPSHCESTPTVWLKLQQLLVHDFCFCKLCWIPTHQYKKPRWVSLHEFLLWNLNQSTFQFQRYLRALTSLRGVPPKAKQKYNWINLHTFDNDLDDVVRSAQLVYGRAAVVPGVGFTHVRNLERFLEVLKGRPAARQLSSILLPGDIWSGPVTDTTCFSGYFWFLLLLFLIISILGLFHRTGQLR